MPHRSACRSLAPFFPHCEQDPEVLERLHLGKGPPPQHSTLPVLSEFVMNETENLLTGPEPEPDKQMKDERRNRGKAQTTENFIAREIYLYL